ncbi:MAG: arylsulfatase, partial [Planctomycetaceae bacterium]|nr:arylsulfatase [Planctomycetaceae bacterium]
SRRDPVPAGREPSPLPVQLYDTDADIGETRNLAEEHPEIAAQLATAYEKHIANIEVNKRATATMIRPEGSISAELPGRAKKNRAKKN